MRISVAVVADDPVSELGVAAQLRGQPEIQVVLDNHNDRAAVAVVALDEVNDEGLQLVRTQQQNAVAGVVLVVNRLDDSAVLAAVETGVGAVLRRRNLTSLRLVTAIQQVERGEGSLPPDLLGGLLQQVGHLQRNVLGPRGIAFSGLKARESDILELVAEGLDTAEIASKLSYSERTVKNVLHDITSRFNLRNRAHAVAYGIRHGYI